MKLLNKLSAAVATLALVATAFTGCVNSYDDRDPVVNLATFYLRGNMNNWCNDSLDDGVLTANGDGTYSITYTAKSSTDEFAIANSGWTQKFCAGTSVAVGGDEVVLEAGGDNAKVTGQVVGNTYKMTITPGGTNLTVVVEGSAASASESVLPTYIIGDPAKGASGEITTMWSSSAAPLGEYSDNVATFTFTCDGADAWGSDGTQSSFKLIVPNEDLTNVDTNWGKCDITVDGGWALQGAGSADNMVISGLTANNSYIISVYASGDTIFVKCDTAN